MSGYIVRCGAISLMAILAFSVISAYSGTKNNHSRPSISEHDLENITVGSCPTVTVHPEDYCRVAAVNCGTTEATCKGDWRTVCPSYSGSKETTSRDGDVEYGQIRRPPCYRVIGTYQYGFCKWQRHEEGGYCAEILCPDDPVRPCPGEATEVAVTAC